MDQDIPALLNSTFSEKPLFIILTNTKNQKVYVRPDTIAVLTRLHQQNSTDIRFINTWGFEVVETPKEIFAAINEAYGEPQA